MRYTVCGGGLEIFSCYSFGTFWVLLNDVKIRNPKEIMQSEEKSFVKSPSKYTQSIPNKFESIQ